MLTPSLSQLNIENTIKKESLEMALLRPKARMLRDYINIKIKAE